MLSGSIQPRGSFPDASVVVSRPDGGVWAVAQAALDSQGKFNSTVARLGSSDSVGTYRVSVRYSGSLGSTTFNVTKTHSYRITVAVENFTVAVKSSSNITGFAFSQANMRINFTAQGSGRDFAYVIVPQNLLSGTVTWMSNGQVTAAQSYNVNATHTGYWIGYTKPAQLMMTGTRVIPEFPQVGVIVALVATLMALALGSKGLRRKHLNWPDRSNAPPQT